VDDVGSADEAALGLELLDNGGVGVLDMSADVAVSSLLGQYAAGDQAGEEKISPP
jgi:hypothetical protein